MLVSAIASQSPERRYCMIMVCMTWNPHEQKSINMIEMMQRKAARYTQSRYNNTTFVASMLQELEWEKMCCRRISADLICFFKAQHGLIAAPSPSPQVKKQFCQIATYKYNIAPRRHINTAFFLALYVYDALMPCKLPSPNYNSN